MLRKASLLRHFSMIYANPKVGIWITRDMAPAYLLMPCKLGVNLSPYIIGRLNIQFGKVRFTIKHFLALVCRLTDKPRREGKYLCSQTSKKTTKKTDKKTIGEDHRLRPHKRPIIPRFLS